MYRAMSGGAVSNSARWRGSASPITEPSSMTETTHNEHTAKTFDLSFALLSDVRHQDENLFLEAAQRWENSRQGFVELMASTPDVLTSIQMLIRQELALESDQIVLRFNSSADRA